MGRPRWAPAPPQEDQLLITACQLPPGPHSDDRPDVFVADCTAVDVVQIGEAIEPELTYQGSTFKSFFVAAGVEEACKRSSVI